MSVYGVGGNSDTLRNKTPAIQELDISKNLLPSWASVAKIIECLPKVINLNARYVYIYYYTIQFDSKFYFCSKFHLLVLDFVEMLPYHYLDTGHTLLTIQLYRL